MRLWLHQRKNIADEIARITFTTYTAFQALYSGHLVLLGFLLADISSLLFISAVANAWINGSFLAAALAESKKSKLRLYLPISLAFYGLLFLSLKTSPAVTLGASVLLSSHMLIASLLLRPKSLWLIASTVGFLLATDLFFEIFGIYLFDSTQANYSYTQSYILPFILFFPFIVINLITFLVHSAFRRAQQQIAFRAFFRKHKLQHEVASLSTKIDEYSNYHSHELRAPVARLIAISSLLEGDIPVSQKKMQSLLRSLSSSSKELDKLLRQMNRQLESEHV